MFKHFSLLTGLGLATLASSACIQSREPQAPSADHQPVAGLPGGPLFPSHAPSERALDTQAERERAEFWNTRRLEQTQGLWNLNTKRARYMGSRLTRAPVFAPYWPGYVIPSISVKFTPAFESKLPQELQKQIRDDRPEQLELFWSVQAFHSSTNKKIAPTGLPNQVVRREAKVDQRYHQLKAHFWVEPEADFQDPGAPEILFHRSLAMQLFGLLDPIEHQLQAHHSTEVEVFVHHENRISPPGVGEVDFQVLDQVKHTAFWSYVYDLHAPPGIKKKAVATLHWILDRFEGEMLLEGLGGLSTAPTLGELTHLFSVPQRITAKTSVSVYDANGGDFDNKRLKVEGVLDLRRLLPTLENLMK